MAWLTLLKHSPPHIGYHAEFGRSTPNGTSVIKEICLKIWFLASRLSRSLKVIGTHTDRSAICDFLLMSHSNYMDRSRTVSKKNGDFSRKSQNFPTPCILRPAEGVPWKWVPALGVKTNYTVSTKKVPPCIHCHNSDKQCQILNKFWTNNAMSNCKQITKFK